MSKKPQIELETTTFWDYPSQSYGNKQFGNKEYPGVTPAFVVWNLLRRYTRKGDLLVDPMAGSGTSLDVARDLERKALGFDLQPQRNDILPGNARKLPLPAEKADFVFIDPPYSTHIKYSGKEECLGELNAGSEQYFTEMKKVIAEINRILKKGKYLGLYISDSYEKDKGFLPIGFRVFNILSGFFTPVDIVSVKRYNAKLRQDSRHKEAAKQNYFIRGFNYLFIMRKEPPRKTYSR
jgi:DNA modification methylase